jgi:hypothetical protein
MSFNGNINQRCISFLRVSIEYYCKKDGILMRNSVNKRKDLNLSLPIIYFIIANVYFSFGRTFVGFLGITDLISLYLIYGTTALLILFAFRYLNKRSIIYLFMMETFFIVSYFYSFTMGYLNSDIILQYTIITLVICIPFCVLVMSMGDLTNLYRGLLKASYWNIALLVIYFIVEGNAITYSMPATYQVLFCGVIHVNEFFSKKNTKKTILGFLVIVEITLIFIKGSRGPLFILILYIMLKVLTEFWKNKKVMIWFVIGSISVVFVFLNLNQILDFVSSILLKYNIYSRNLLLITNNSLFDDSGRSELHDLARNFITQNPILGYGASSDVNLLGGAYVHSFYLELFINYGVILGFIIFAFITIESVKSLFIRSGQQKNLLLIFIVLGYVMLMISSTYLQNIYLFLFLGLVFRQNHYSKRFTSTMGR